jgi:cellobiose-specific phosphotransferase system component IIA
MSKAKKTDISKIDLEELKEKTAGSPSSLPYAHHSGSALVKPEDKGKLVGRAVAAMHSQTDMQMAQIYQQMQLLADQAKRIKSRVEVSERIYQASINFEPLINHTYYLYEREDNSDFLSMVAPEEWGRKKPFVKFVAKVKLLADHTWELMENNPS